MDIFLQDPNEIRLPPGEVRIRQLSAHSSPNGQRVRVYLEIDPFQKRPNADLVITDQQGHEVATTSIIQNPSRKMELTMHLRTEKLEGAYTLSAVIYYFPEEPEKSQESMGQEGKDMPPDLSMRVEVDQREIRFDISTLTD